jgi:hypothetical protein
MWELNELLPVLIFVNFTDIGSHIPVFFLKWDKHKLLYLKIYIHFCAYPARNFAKYLLEWDI